MRRDGIGGRLRSATLAGVGAVLVSFVLAQSAWATFTVTDEHTGRTFDALTYLNTPYPCSAPCAFTFTAIPGCTSGNGTHYFVWVVRDAADAVIANAFNVTTWRYDFPNLGRYSVLETESTDVCGTGGTFRLEALDRSPPETTITSGPGRLTHDRRPTFAFVSSEAGSTFACRLDGLAFAPCVTPMVAPPLADGVHVFAVRAIDRAGNADPSPAALSFRVRRLRPVPAVLRRSWTHARRSTGVARLEVRRIPAGGAVAVRCRGGGCPFGSRRFRPHRGVASLTRSFRAAQLRPRAVVKISVSAPDAIAKLFRITVRRPPRDPQVRILCRAPGARAPSRC